VSDYQAVKEFRKKKIRWNSDLRSRNTKIIIYVRNIQYDGRLGEEKNHLPLMGFEQRTVHLAHTRSNKFKLKTGKNFK